MKHHSVEVSLSTRKRMEISDISEKVNRIVDQSGISNGLVNVWVPHATAAVAVNERDVVLWGDILSAFERLAPIKGNYSHNAKYGSNSAEQNAHAHILNCLIKPDVTVPLDAGRMMLGTWQSILFIEMDGPRTRSIHVHVLGE